MAATPIPLAPPCTNKDSPFLSFPLSKTLLQTVKTVSGSEAASTKDRFDGIGRHCPSGTVQNSAYPPPETNAHTLSPTFHLEELSPKETTVPAISRPGISCDVHGGG